MRVKRPEHADRAGSIAQYVEPRRGARRRRCIRCRASCEPRAKFGTEIERRVGFGCRSDQILLPEVQERGGAMHPGDPGALRQGHLEIALSLFKRLAPVIRPMKLPVEGLQHREAGVRLAIARILCDRLCEQTRRARERLVVPVRIHHRRAPKQEKVVRLAVCGLDDIEPRLFRRTELDLQRVDNPPGHLVLNREDVAQVPIESFGPKMSPGFRLDQLRIDPDPAACAPDAAFKNCTDAKFTGDDTDVDRLAFVSEARIAGDHQEAADLGEVGDHVLGDPVSEIFLLGIAAHVLERQHGDRGFVGRSGGAFPAPTASPASRALPRRAVQPAANRPAPARRCF